VEALEATRFAHVYPRPLYGLLDRLAAVRRRVLAVGAGYRPDAVRLVAVVTGDPGSGPVTGSGPVPGWPAGVPVPPIAGDEIVGVADLRGSGARAVVRAVPPDWSTFRTADGRHLQAAWRRLLPHEGRALRA